MLTKMTAFLARAPALQGLSLTVGDVGPAPYTAGLWCRGITVLDRRENLLGRVTQRCRAEFAWSPFYRATSAGSPLIRPRAGPRTPSPPGGEGVRGSARGRMRGEPAEVAR